MLDTDTKRRIDTARNILVGKVPDPKSGDEGFVFNADGSGSSRWFVLSAAVIRQTNDLQMVSCLKEVRTVLNKEPKTPLHFVELKHEQRVPYIRRVRS